MRCLSTALAAIGFISVSAFASLPAATEPTGVNIPQFPGGLVIGVSGFYLQPSDSNNDLGYIIVDQTTAPFNSTIKNIDPGYDWGWGVNFSYIFPNTGNDLNVSYFQLETDDSSPLISGANLRMVDPTSTLLGGLVSTAKAKAEYSIHQVDATLGQFINVGYRLTLHPNAGLRWLDLEREIKGTYSIVTSSATTTVFTKEESNFQGIGPLLDLDANYYIGYGVGAVGHFDSGVLIGDIDSKLDATTIVSNPPLALLNEFENDDIARVIPVVDAKLGADYTCIFSNVTHSDLTLELGWQTSHYFNAVHRVFANGVGRARALSGKTSSVGLNGPYASLVLHI